MLPRALVACAVASGCVPAAEDLPAEDRSAIVGGALDHGDGAVVGLSLTTQSEGWWCTGMLVSPRVVLTAAHCVMPPPGGVVIFGSSLTDPESDPDHIGTRNVVLTTLHESFDAASIRDGYDFGLVLMDAAAPAGIAALPLNRTQLTDVHIGQTLRLVGFGDTAHHANDAGVKRATEAQLTGFLPRLLQFGDAAHNICLGDSGGPVLTTLHDTEVVAAVISFTRTNDEGVGCLANSFGGNVYEFTSWIDDWVNANDPSVGCGAGDGCAFDCPLGDPDCPCAEDGACPVFCPTPETDPDCIAACQQNSRCMPTGCVTPDPDCESCGSDGTCMEGCTDDPDCDPITADCGPDGRCVEDCVPRDEDCPPESVHDSCVDDGDCPGGTCVEVDDERVCVDRCEEGAGCPDGFECANLEGSGLVCIPIAGADDDRLDGGCAATPAHRHRFWPLALILALALTRSRRHDRPRQTTRSKR